MITKLIKEIGTTEQIVYTCPTDKVSTISRFSITNNSEEEITFDLRYYNAAANDYITVLSTVDSSIDAIVTYEESDV